MNVIFDMPRIGRPQNSGYNICDIALMTQSSKFGRNRSLID